MDEYIHSHLCGWACACAMTRMNFVIAGLTFSFILYFLSETTLMFEQTANFFTGMPIPEAKAEEKSVERFLEGHYMLLCTMGPGLITAIALNFYLRKLASKMGSVCQCWRAKGLLSPLWCCQPQA